MRIGIIVFARMSSRRLPGKALMPVAGASVLEHTIRRCRRVELADGLALATSHDPSDDPLAAFARGLGLDVHRGPLEDVAQRALDCAIARGWNAFARICGDRIFLQPEDVTAAIRVMRGASLTEAHDMVSNGQSGTVPVGLTVEVVRTAALERVLRETSDHLDREHLTRYMYRNESAFRIAYIDSPPDAARGCMLAVDTEEDLERARYVASQLDSIDSGSLSSIIGLARKWESIRMGVGP